MKSLCVILLVLCASTFAFGADPEFRGIVRSIEHTYGVHHTHIPFLGLAMFWARPAGVHGFKLAVFEGFQPPTDSAELRRTIESSLGPGWYPFVRVQSKNKSEGETTLIYTYPCGNKLRMMIVNLEPAEAVVLKMELSEHAIEKWLKEPGEEADGHSSRHPHDDENPPARAKPALAIW